MKLAEKHNMPLSAISTMLKNKGRILKAYGKKRLLEAFANSASYVPGCWRSFDSHDINMINKNDGKCCSFSFTDYVNVKDHEQTCYMDIEGDLANREQGSAMAGNYSSTESTQAPKLKHCIFK